MTTRFRLALAVACVATLGLLAPMALRADNLVTNGNFSANGGSLDGWTSNQNSTNFYWAPQTIGTTDYALSGCFGSSCITGPVSEQNYLSQDLATDAGSAYTLTFEYDPGAGRTNQLEVLFGNTVVENLLNLPNTLKTYTITGLVAPTNNTELTFLGRQDASYDLVTNVGVLTPEPTGLLLMGTGLLAMGVLMRRNTFQN